MKGKIIRDWNKVNFRSTTDLKKFEGAMQHFMRMPAQDKAFKAAMQQFASTGDFPTNINQVLEKIHATPDWDNGFEQIFDVRDFTGTNSSGFDILDVESGLTFAKVLPGEKVKMFKMSGAKTSVSFDQYGGALGWLRVWFEDQQWWAVEDTAIAFRNKAYSSRAANFYALIEAVTNTQAWQGSSSDAAAVRDAKTINAAVLAILTACKDKGYGINANTPMVLLCPLALKDRITAALAYQSQAVVGSPTLLQYNVKPVYTLMLSSNSYYYVALPGKKIKAGYRQDLTLFNAFDPMAYADTVVGWMRYGGAIGDTDQIKKCSIA